MMAASSGSGRRHVGVSRPRRSESSRKRLRGAVARPREREYPPAFPCGDLRDDVRRGAEAVEPEAHRIAGPAERAVANQAGAQQRRRVGVPVFVRDGKQYRASATANSE